MTTTILFQILHLALTPSAAALTTVNGCQAITQPGDYTLGNDIAVPGDISMTSGCLYVQNVANVSLDCAQRQITGSRGVYVKNAQNVVVKNCALKGPYSVLHVAESSDIRIENNLVGPSDQSNTQQSSILVQSSERVVVTGNSMAATLSLVGTSNSIVADNAMLSPIAAIPTEGGKIVPTIIHMINGHHNVIQRNLIDGKAKVILNDFFAAAEFGGADDGIVLVDVSDVLVEQNIIKNVWDVSIEGLGTWEGVVIRQNTLDGASVGAIGGWWKAMGNKTDYGFKMVNCKVEKNDASNVGTLFAFSPLVPNHFEMLYFNDDAAAQAAFPSNQFTGNTMAASLESRLTELYVTILGREPDAEGRSYWLEQLKAGKISLAQIAENFRAVAGLNGLYLEILGREADQSGRDYWVNQLASGKVTLDDVRRNFVWCKNLPVTDANHCQ